MHRSSQPVSDDRLGQEDDEVRRAFRFAAAAALVGVGFLIVAALWVSTCAGAADIDTAACGVPQRTVLGLGGPVILMMAALWAFLRTYQVWRERRTWWGWQGAGWFLLSMMLLTLTMGFPALAGPVLGS
jgi:hypothetical protein